MGDRSDGEPGGWWMGGVPPYGYDLRYETADGALLYVFRYVPDGLKQILDESGSVTRTLARGESLGTSKRDRAKLAPSSPSWPRVRPNGSRSSNGSSPRTPIRERVLAVVENGKLAADAALARGDEGNPFDVILIDMQMPVMDGYESTALLRQKGYTCPIIALTASAMAGDRQKFIDAGCDNYATKPNDRKTLVAKIQEWRKTLPIPGKKRASLTAAHETADLSVR